MYYSLNNKEFRQYDFKIVIIDVNSMFMYSRNPAKKLYELINKLKEYFGQKILIINVIDNGRNKILTRTHKTYKANRRQAVYNTHLNIQSKSKYLVNIQKIIRVDNKFVNHLSFYYEGEADFKIGYILYYIYKYCKDIIKQNILVISKDKDMILCNILSCVLIKRFIQNRVVQYLLDDNVDVLHKLTKLYFLRNISDFYYYLILYGDRADNIDRLLSLNDIKLLFNEIYKKNNCLSLDLIIDRLPEIRDDIIKNKDMIDIFNLDLFSNQQIQFMKRSLDIFFKENNYARKKA